MTLFTCPKILPVYVRMLQITAYLPFIKIPQLTTQTVYTEECQSGNLSSNEEIENLF